MRIIPIFPLVTLLVACSTDEPGPDVPWEADVDLVQAEEVVILRGPAGTDAPGDPGVSDPAGEEGFGRVSGAALDAAGRIHVLDAQAQQVFVFDPGGTYLHSLGRAGEGPGEFSRPSWLSVHGEQVLVRDARGISIFHAAGEWLGGHDPSETRTVRSWRVGDRGFIEAAMYGAGRAGIDPRITLVLADSGGVVDTLAVGQAGALYFRTQQMATALTIPLCDLVHVAVGPDRRIFLADGDRGTLSRYTWGETLELEASWEVAPPGEPVPEDRAAELLERVPSQFRDRDEEFVVPPFDARLCAVHAGAAERSGEGAGEHATGHVWVRLQGIPDRAADAGGEADGPGQPPSDPSDEGELWRAIDGTTGEPLLDARFPPGVRISGFGGDPSGGARAVGVHLGDLGVQSVRVYLIGLIGPMP